MEDYNDRRVRYYDRGAHDYDGGWHGGWLPDEGERAGFEEELGALRHTISSLPAGRVLDVACGTGVLTQHLKGEVMGLDGSEEMLEIACLLHTLPRLLLRSSVHEQLLRAFAPRGAYDVLEGGPPGRPRVGRHGGSRARYEEVGVAQTRDGLAGAHAFGRLRAPHLPQVLHGQVFGRRTQRVGFFDDKYFVAVAS